MSLREALAALLLKGPSHGYRLHATLEAELGPTWETSVSQLYLTLSRMQRDGLLIAARVPQANRPDRLLLELTAAGRKLAESWLVSSGAPRELVARIAIGRLVMPEKKLQRLVADAVAERSSALAGLRQLRGRVRTDGFQVEAVDAQIFATQAQLRWVASLLDRFGEIAARPPAQLPGQDAVRNDRPA